MERFRLARNFRKGRVHATFDGIPYDGSIVNMSVQKEDGSVCYILGMLKAIRTQLGHEKTITGMTKPPVLS